MTPLYQRPGAVWLLDVDGVLNVDNPGWSGGNETAVVHFGTQPFEFRWSPLLIERIKVIYGAGLVDIRWCSTWTLYADRLEKLWDLPALPRCPGFERPFDTPQETVAAKRAAARSIIDAGHRLVWTDDDAIPLNPGRRFFTRSGRALLVQTSMKHGLIHRQLEQITAFAQAGAR